MGHVTGGDVTSQVGAVTNARNSRPDPVIFLCLGFLSLLYLACGILEWEWAVLEEVGNNNSKGKKLRAIRFLQGSQSKRS